MNRIFTVIATLVLTSNLFFTNTEAEMQNKIIVTVGGSLISSIDIRNEIITTLLLTGQEVNQENINKNKNFAVKSLIKNTIKRNEITKFEVSEYSKEDLNNYLREIAKKFNTDVNGLRDFFKIHELSYVEFVGVQKTQLLWNTLMENEVKKLVDKGEKIDTDKLKKKILFKKKNDKLGMFSRSHFSNLENTVSIKFQ